MIHFKCSQCQTPYAVEDELAGRKGQCETCGFKFWIPSLPATPKANRRSGLVFGLVTLVAVSASWFVFRYFNTEKSKTVAPTALVLAPGAGADGILHQWNFDEVKDWHDSPFGPLTNAPTVLLDLAGGWDLTPVGLTATNWVSGREGMAVELPGETAYLESSRNLALDLGGTASLAFWLCTTQRGGTNSWESPGVTGAVNEKHTGGIQWGWLNQDGSLMLTVDREVLGATMLPVNDGFWHFVVMTRDAVTGAGQMYLDGAPMHSRQREGPTGKRSLVFHSLGRIEGAPVGFAGRLDKVTVFNRVITADEVKELMVNHAPKAWDTATEGSNGKTFVTASVLTRAYDVECDALSVRGWTLPAHGTVSYNGDGAFSYTGAAGFTGKDEFGVVVQDEQGGFHQAKMKITVVAEQYGSGAPTAGDYLAKIEAIYNAHPSDLGVALSANDDALLKQVNEANRGIVVLIQKGNPATRDGVYAALAAHVQKYWFLKYQKLDTQRFHHVPSIALQNWVMLTYARPETPTLRREIADVMGLTGIVRDIYLQAGLALGDNGHLDQAQLGTVRDMMRHQPRELFPDSIISFDQLFGDKRGGFIWTPNSTKNTFGCGVGMANEWARDLTKAIEEVDGKGTADGDYFTFVMGHEVTHSMDAYLGRCGNKDLRRRWGQMLCNAAGPDIVAGANGWIDWGATRKHFQEAGFYHPPGQSWDEAWKNFWAAGPGAKFKGTSFMRSNIDWFLHSPQESLATQANHHFASGTGRLIGAIARFRHGVATGNSPEKANLTEVVDFIDYLSVGMNRVALPKTTTVMKPEKHVNWTIHLADLERDDNGRITRITVDNRICDFTLDAGGTVTDVCCSIAAITNPGKAP